MKKIGLALAAWALGTAALTACGGDDDAGGSTEAFCAALIEANAQDDVESLDQLIAVFVKIADSAPGEIKDDARNMADKMKELADLEAQALAGTPDEAAELSQDAEAVNASLQSSADKVEAFATSSCDNLPEGFFS